MKLSLTFPEEWVKCPPGLSLGGLSRHSVVCGHTAVTLQVSACHARTSRHRELSGKCRSLCVSRSGEGMVPASDLELKSSHGEVHVVLGRPVAGRGWAEHTPQRDRCAPGLPVSLSAPLTGLFLLHCSCGALGTS